MSDDIRHEINELICLQINVFKKQGSLSHLDLQDCFERFDRLKRLFRDLDGSKPIRPAPRLKLA